ncbi:hypothetical protein [Streptomyces sp. NPDC088915]|uniref:DUF6197 family protein n=1 Tax=Streptomyces sp. NPDC088915 TaxID=3365912 RepID=UPI003803F557
MTTDTASSSTLLEKIAHHLAGPGIWYGPSGEKVTGEAVAAHLQAAAALMEREGWDPQLYTRESRRSLYYALDSTRDDGQGDEDTERVAERVVEAVLTAATGAPYVRYEAWNHHATRTLAEVLQVCQAAASVARHYGPGPATTSPQIEPGQNR